MTVGHGTAGPSCQGGCCDFGEEMFITKPATECKFDDDLLPRFKMGKENCSDVYFKT